MKVILSYFIGLILIFILSSFMVIDLSSITPEHPGGSMLEVAFWLTSMAFARESERFCFCDGDIPDRARRVWYRVGGDNDVCGESGVAIDRGIGSASDGI